MRAEKEENGWTISGIAYDETGYVISIEYSIDGGEWCALSCRDGVFDEGEEEFSFKITSDDLDEGEHIVVVKVEDNSHNTGAVHMVLEVE